MQTELSNFELQACELRLKKLFSQTYFSVCDVNSVIKVTGAIPPKRLQNVLDVLHCVDYNEMTQEFRDELLANTMSAVSGGGFTGEIALAQHLKTRRPLLEDR